MSALKIILEYIYFAYPLIFILMFVEGGDGTLLASGFLVRLEFLNFFIVYPVALIAVFLRDIILYRIGERYGEKLIAKFGRFFFVTPARLTKLKARLENGGGRTIFLSKFLYGLNHITILAVGAIKFDFRRFLKIEAATIFLWGTLMLALGFFIGHGFTLIKHYVKDIALLLTVAFAAIILLAEFGITSRTLLSYRNGGLKGSLGQTKVFQKGKLSIVVLLLVLVLGCPVVFFRADLISGYHKMIQKFGTFRESGGMNSRGLSGVAPIKSVEKIISAPPPLRLITKEAAVKLTTAGVVEWTNKQRIAVGLPPLKENLSLNSAATTKAQDMFEKQYFAHNAPDGRGPADLAGEANYEFIAIGENLALGNFDGDKALVEAWMESPGHRENILFSGYKEIGVAVVEGTFESQKTWIAVQEFGRPLSDCPSVDQSLVAEINGYKTEAADLDKKISSMQDEVRLSRPRTKEEYETEVERYNNLVNQYNDLVAAIKSLVAEYNRQVGLFNQCIKQ